MNSSAVYELNQYGDISKEEFAIIYLLNGVNNKSLSESSLVASKMDYKCYQTSPDAFNWVEQGAVTRV